MPKATVRANARALPKAATLPTLEKPLADQLSASTWILDELTAAEAKLREARTKAQDQPQAGADIAPKRDADFNARLRDAYMDLEPDIRDLRQMASIVEALFEGTFKAAASKGGWHMFQITDEEFERLQFAVFRTSEMADNLDVAYLKAIEEART